MKLTIITLAIVAAFLAGGNSNRTPNTLGESLTSFDRQGHKVLQVGWNSFEGNDHPLCYMGDVEQVYNGTHIAVGDLGRIAEVIAPGGLARLGDPNFIVNGTAVIADDENERIVLTKPLVMRSPNGHWWSYSPDNTGALVATDLGTELE